MAADKYWQARLLKDRRLADRAAAEVAREVHGALRGQYLQVARRLDELYAEAQAKGTLSRSKLWAYRSYIELEKDLRKYSEAGSMIQEEALTKRLNKVFEDVIGAPVERFNPKNVLLPYSPRAFIDTAWSGENYSARIWKNTNRLADQIRTEAQLVVQGLKSPGQIKRELMHDYDVSFHQAERLIDTEISYVLNKANLEQYRRYGVGKVTIINLDVNTCEKCKALEGQVFRIEDAPVLPIHPRCHCSYCVPAEGDDAEVTASGSDLASVYADAGVEGYERVSAGDGRKIVFSMAEIRSEPEVLQGRTSGTMQDSAAVAVSATTAKAETETAKTLENKGFSGVSVLQGDAESGIIDVYRGMIERKTVIKNSEVENGLPIRGEPESIADLVDDEGRVLKRRVYGEDGLASIDYDTGDHNRPDIHATGAHKHIFDYAKKRPRGKNFSLTEEELLMNSDIIREGVNYFAGGKPR